MTKTNIVAKMLNVLNQLFGLVNVLSILCISLFPQTEVRLWKSGHSVFN